jgi:hypothetical protein
MYNGFLCTLDRATISLFWVDPTGGFKWGSAKKRDIVALVHKKRKLLFLLFISYFKARRIIDMPSLCLLVADDGNPCT